MCAFTLHMHTHDNTSRIFSMIMVTNGRDSYAPFLQGLSIFRVCLLTTFVHLESVSVSQLVPILHQFYTSLVLNCIVRSLLVDKNVHFKP